MPAIGGYGENKFMPLGGYGPGVSSYVDDMTYEGPSTMREADALDVVQRGLLEDAPPPPLAFRENPYEGVPQRGPLHRPTNPAIGFRETPEGMLRYDPDYREGRQDLAGLDQLLLEDLGIPYDRRGYDVERFLGRGVPVEDGVCPTCGKPF